MKYRALVFDFFGVVCSEVAPFWFEEHIPEGAAELKEKYVRPADRGEVDESELFDELAELTGIPAEEIRQDWEARAHINTELMRFIKSLRSDYKIGLLSNAPTRFFRALLHGKAVGPFFDAIVVSGEIGHTKPEPEAYQAILAALEVRPEEALMIDDNPRLVEGAKEVGMAGHQFTSVQELRNLLGRER